MKKKININFVDFIFTAGSGICSDFIFVDLFIYYYSTFPGIFYYNSTYDTDELANYK